MGAIVQERNAIVSGPVDAPPEKPTIVLVNQISRHGHLDLYARLYSACLLGMGYRVVLLAEHESGVAEWLGSQCSDYVSDFTCLTRSAVRAMASAAAMGADASVPTGVLAATVGNRSLFASIRRVYAAEGMTGVALRLAFYWRRLRSHVISRLVRLVGRTSKLAELLGRTILRSGGRGSFGVSFIGVVDEIVAAERLLGVRPELVLFLYLDMMSEGGEGCRYVEKHLGVPWAGILFHPRCTGDTRDTAPERYFHSSNCRGAAFLNSHGASTYSRIFPSHSFGVVPDVTDAATSPQVPEFVRQMLARAAGRTIVLQLGSISPHKNITQLFEVIASADSQQYFFAIVGEVFWESHGGREKELRRFFSAPPENCLARVEYLEDERELNSIISVVDILYAVYVDFRGSSNTLTKAAIFEKPVIVSDEHVMGERVRRFNIGDSVKNGDVADIVRGLDEVRRRPRSEFGFASYRREHSTERLRDNLGKLLPRWASAISESGADVSNGEAYLGRVQHGVS
jgi:hypothetical protein